MIVCVLRLVLSTQSAYLPLAGDSPALKLIPSEDIILMDSLPGDRTMFLVHPIEGDVQHLSQLASKWNGPIYGLQCTANTPVTSIEDMASHYLQVISSTDASGY